MKRTIPLLITSIGGFILVASAFIPAAQTAGETVTVWFNILAAIAMVLGGANLAQVQLKVISDRKPGWGYAAIVLASFVVTLVIGLAKFGVRPDTSSQYPGEIWEPIPLEVFPTYTYALTAREQAVLEPVLDRLRAKPPASVASQLRFEDGQLTFAGWANPDQVRDMIAADEDVLWKSVAERLGKLAAVPNELENNVLHRGDRNVLAAVGTIPEGVETDLRNTISSPAVDRLVAASRRETSASAIVIPPRLPKGVVVGGELISLTSTNGTAAVAPQVDAKNEEIVVTGAMTPATRDILEKNYLLSRPRNGLSREAAVEQANEWSLEADARDQYLTALTQPVDADALILAMKSAAVLPSVTPRSWTDIAADVESGNPSPTLTTTFQPSAGWLGDEAAVRDFAVNHSADESLFIDEASNAVPAYATGLPVYQSFPTNTERTRDIAYELLATGKIDKKTADRMINDYRLERGISRAIESLYIRSQQPKFAYAADYAKNGSAFWWIYEYLFKPLTATMFSMLAFYISSAAFRAFRAKNLEAALLLGTAFIVLLGRTFAGVWLTSWLPDSLSFLRIENLTVFIMSVFNTAGNRAIMIGIALGLISTSLKVLLGMDRSYLGKE